MSSDANDRIARVPTGSLVPNYVVGIGTSAGGLEALERLFRDMPTDTGMTFVVINHLSPDFDSQLAELIERHASLPAVPVNDRERLRPDTIFVLPPGRDMVVVGSDVVSSPRVDDKALSLPINSFFRSLATEWGDKSIAIVLSGTGRDGTAGVMDVREAGGLVLAQSEDTARFTGMPTSAIATGCVDFVLSPDRMADALISFRDRPQRHIDHAEKAYAPEAGFPAIFNALHNAYDIDFNYYKPQTITRRIERRISLGSERISVEEYGRRIPNDPAELNQLYKDLLIGVTRFFRDPEAFEVLATDVIPDIVENLGPEEEARVWVCGCSTGEEAYSIAMLFLEEFERRDQTPRIKVLATDLHRESLQQASEGSYPLSSFAEISEELLEKYFVPDGDDRFRVTKALRKPLIFSEHNLLKDPPFTRIDLVSCRNLLIYLQPIAQTRAITFFLFSLRMHGHLMLGSSEGLGDMTDPWETISQHWKVFRKVQENRPGTGTRAPLAYGSGLSAQGVRRQQTSLAPAYDSLLERFIPTGILVNAKREAVHVFQGAAKYLKPQKGRVTNELFYMSEGAVRSAMMSALRGAQQADEQVTLRGIPVGLDPDGHKVDVVVDPIHPEGERDAMYMVSLHPWPDHDAATESEGAPRAADPAAADIAASSVKQIQLLEQELQMSRESLQRTVEELEASNEEMQATNEELLASNEELQSTNEELHSVNEELYSVNSEHEQKIKELNTITSDIQNLIRSTDLATVFVDLDWRITLFTPKAADVFPVVTGDVGRSLRDLQPSHPDPDLYDDVSRVMSEEVSIERQLSWGHDRTLLRRTSPYQDADGKKVVGVAVTYLDISQLAKAQADLEASRRELETSERHLREAQRVAKQGSWYWRIQEDIVVWTDQAQLVFGAEPGGGPTAFEEFLAVVPEDQRDTVRFALDDAVHRGLPCDIEFWIDRSDGERRCIRAQATLERDARGEPEVLTGTVIDVTEQKQAELALNALNEELARANRAKSTFLAMISHEIRTPLNAILGTAYLLSQSPLDDEQRSRLDAIQSAGTVLRDLVSDVLDLSKIEAGELTLQSAPFSLPAVLAELDAEFRPLAEARGLSLTLRTLADTTPRNFVGDRSRLLRMLGNLLDNALKFTEQGSIELGCHVSEWSDDTVTLHFDVSDTGIGVPEERADDIFQPFRQLSTSTTRRHGGTGLGLSIVRDLSERMDGQSGVEPNPGGGSRFWFEVRLTTHRGDVRQASDTGKNSPSAYLQVPGVRVFVVDDNLPSLHVCCSMLEHEGAVATPFQHAVDAVATLEQGDVPDVIIMDVQMPDMDGYEATRRIRSTKLAAHVPVIALTAGALESEREQALASGMTDFIAKPLDPADFLGTVRRAAQRARGAELPVVARPSPSADRSESDVPWPRIDGIDLSAGRSLVSGRRKVFERLLLDFAREAANVGADVRAAVTDGRTDTARSLLHLLRGQASSIGANDLSAAATALETWLLQDAQEADAELQAFLERHEQLVSSIQAWRDERTSEEDLSEAREVDCDQVRSLIARLRDAIAQHLVSATKVSSVLRDAVAGTSLAATYRPIDEAVQGLDFDAASAALSAFEDAARSTGCT